MAGSDKLYLQPVLEDLLEGLSASITSIDGIVDSLGQSVTDMKNAVDGVSSTLDTVKTSIDTTNTNLTTVNNSILAPNKFLKPYDQNENDNIGVGFGANGTYNYGTIFPYTLVGRFRANFDGAVSIIVNAKKSSAADVSLVLCDLSANTEFEILSHNTLSITATKYEQAVPVIKGHSYAVSVKGSVGDVILAAETVTGLGETPLVAFYVIDYAQLQTSDYVLSLDE